MKRPGKFSDRYDKTRHRQIQKRNLRLTGAALGLFLLFFIPYLSGKLTEFEANGGTFPNLTTASRTVGQSVPRPATTPTVTQAGPATQAAATPGTKPGTTPATTAATTPATTTAAATKAGPLFAGYSLTNGANIVIAYEETAPGQVRFLGVTGADGAYTFDISPSGGQLLLNETAEQNLILIGSDLKAQDRSFNTYNYAGTGNLRRDVYNKRDGFIWMRNARFFTEDLILFESQVALAMKPMYIWSYIPSTHKYKLVDGTRSTQATLLELTPTGFSVKLDDKTVTITKDLEIVP